MPYLDFKGKSFVYSHHLRVPHRVLREDRGKSFYSKTQSIPDDNLIIHGDNLQALKALMPRYAGKVKCIYIDPPYNTGNEGWCYNDRVNNPVMKEWFRQNGIGRDDLERHDKWLCMMWPRLQLLRELLSDEGVIFVSIDDNECHHLRMIMDEIFGEDQFIADIIAQTNPRGRSLREGIAQTYEHILMYAKDSDQGKIREIPKPQRTVEEYNKEDSEGKYRLLRLRNSGIQFFNKETRPNLFFPIFVNAKNACVSLTPQKGYDIEVLPKDSQGKEGCWTWSRDKIQQNLNLIVGHKTNNGWRIYRKDYLPENGGTTKEKSLWIEKNINHEIGRETLKQINIVFDFPKSVDFIKKCLRLVTDQNAIVLDSFAGSGTTAHAVLDINKEDGGQRKFILVECEDYADTVTAERVRRVIKGVSKAKDEKLKKGLGGSFTYCTLGANINIENLLKCKDMPEYRQFAEYVFYTATGEHLPQDFKEDPSNWFIGESRLYRLHLVYQPHLDFLRGKESALHLELAEKVKTFNQSSKKVRVVFGPAKYLTQKELKRDYNIHFCQLPYDIRKITDI